MPTLTDAPHSCGANARAIPRAAAYVDVGARFDALRAELRRPAAPCACARCAHAAALAVARCDAEAAATIARAAELTRVQRARFAAGATASDGWPHVGSVAADPAAREAGSR